MHVRPGSRDKSTDLQGALKLHMPFCNRISMLQTPRNENWHYSLHVCSMTTDQSMSQGQLTRGLGMRIFLASVVSTSHDFKSPTCVLTGSAHAVWYSHVYINLLYGL